MADVYQEQTPSELELQFTARPGGDDAQVVMWLGPLVGRDLRRSGAPLRSAAFGQRVEVVVIQGGDQHIRRGGEAELHVMRAREAQRGHSAALAAWMPDTAS